MRGTCVRRTLADQEQSAGGGSGKLAEFDLKYFCYTCFVCAPEKAVFMNSFMMMLFT